MQYDPAAEWLETDGLGGFAMGTVGGLRDRRYHGLLLVATTPPTGRLMLVSGVEAWLERDGRRYSLSQQRYAGGIVSPDDAAEVESFACEPWPRWTLKHRDGLRVEHELFVTHGASRCVLRWRLLDSAGAAHKSRLTLCVRPLLAIRDYHHLPPARADFSFDAQSEAGRVTWRPYAELPGVRAIHNGAYEHAPDWYRRFLYVTEQERGFDCHEDLATPGILRFDLSAGTADLILAPTHVSGATTQEGDSADALARAERKRRAGLGDALDRAADAYIARRGSGRTIVAGYPWFTDWGRDTFIAMRGLCIATGRLDVAREILLEWAGAVSEGMLPNRFPDRGEAPEYNAVDASLWYVIAAHDYFEAAERAGTRVVRTDRAQIESAIRAILAGYRAGTRYGIRADADGLLAAGAPGVQLTWMDAKCGDWVVTPRIGKPVEVQALWLAALRVGASLDPAVAALLARGTRSFAERFWSDPHGWLFDVVDENHQPGASDASLRPNQVFAVGGLPFALLDGQRARRVVDVLEQQLWTPLGLRSLAPGDPRYRGRYEGGPDARDSAYHQGTAWGWLLGPFVEAWVRVRGATDDAKREARRRFVAPLMAHLREAGIGHVSEIADADPPHLPRGCPFQAWSVGELLRLDRVVLAT